MKTAVRLGVVVLLLGIAGCGDTADSLMQQTIATTNQMADAIEKEDINGVKAAAAKMKDLQKKAQDPKFKDKVGEEAAKKHEEEAKKAVTRMLNASTKVKPGSDFAKQLADVMKDLKP